MLQERAHAYHHPHARPFSVLVIGILLLLAACGGSATPTAQGTPSAQRTAQARVNGSPSPPVAQNTAVPAQPTPSRAGSPAPAITPVATNPAGATAAPTAPSNVMPVPVTETPGLKSTAGGTLFTSPAQTYRIAVPADWSPPAADPAKPGRVVTRAPKDDITLTIEEIAAPDNWPRLQPPEIAGTLDAAYRKEMPGITLQSATLTAVTGPIDAGLPTYRLTYQGSANGAPVAVERFVTLTFAGAIAITATGAPDAYAALKPTVEGIVGSLVPLRLDAPTPAALAPSGTGGMPIRTLSGLAMTLPAGWAAVASPPAPPGIEYAAQSPDGAQRVRVVRKSVPDGTKLNDFAATVSGEFKGSASAYEVESESAITIGGAPAVRNLYRATNAGKEVVGQSVAFVRNGTGYAVSTEVPAAQYDAKPDDAQTLFDRIESTIHLP